MHALDTIAREVRASGRAQRRAQRPGFGPMKAAIEQRRSAPPAIQTQAPQEPAFKDPHVLFKKFYSEYSQSTGRKVPWDIGTKPQPALLAVADLFHGKVLDVGCGLGNNTLWVATLPAVETVVGVDVVEEALAGARRKVTDAMKIEAAPEATAAPYAKVSFVHADVFALPFETPFDVLLDSAVFHCIGESDEAQERYVRSVTPHIKVGGRAIMLAFSDKNPDPWVPTLPDLPALPRRVSREHAMRVWSAAGWRVDAIDDVTYEVAEGAPIPMVPAPAILMRATRVA